jgi:alpha-galactosidase
MRIFNLFIAGLLIAIPVTAQTKDISGTWVAKVQSPTGVEREYVYRLVVKDGKITGTQTLPFGDAPIVDGKIAGNDIEFTVEMESFGNITKRITKGKIVGDELHIALAAPGPRGGGARGMMNQEIIARRGTPTPSFRAPAVDYKTLPKVELPALKQIPYNGLAKTPPMGWNSWNKFRTKIDDKTIREVADALVSSGMKDAGYHYINIDDGWEDKRDANGVLQPNPNFPDMKALAAYVHSKGLKLGIYSSPGPRTCGGYEGSYGHEEIDARTWAAWGIDYLKYDWCSASRIWKDEDMRAVYQRMGDALHKTGRPIVFSLCQYGRADVGKWGPLVGGNLWRTTGDIRDQYDSMARIGFSQSPLAPFAAPGHWNDPDMLEVGNGAMKPDEYRTHFSLWAILAAPLIAGNDLRNMTADTKEILLNREVIAVDQDKLGKAGTQISKDGDREVWAKPLDKGAHAVGLFNRGEEDAQITVKWTDLQLKGKQKVRDLWAHADRGAVADQFTAKVPAHGVVMIRVAK